MVEISKKIVKGVDLEEILSSNTKLVSDIYSLIDKKAKLVKNIKDLKHNHASKDGGCCVNSKLNWIADKYRYAHEAAAFLESIIKSEFKSLPGTKPDNHVLNSLVDISNAYLDDLQIDIYMTGFVGLASGVCALGTYLYGIE